MNGEIRDLRTPLTGDCSLEIVTASSDAGHEVIRHSAAHIMADAICRLWPDAKLAIEAHREGRAPEKEVLYPSVIDGLRGVEFVDACVRSSARNAAWISLD